MSKSPKQPDAVKVRYDLHDLPTAQHKAGLAGLLLQIESMNERLGHNALPANTPMVAVLEKGPAHAAFQFTAANVQALFDDLYAARWIEVQSKSKWSGAELKDTVEVEVRDENGKRKREKRFVYDMVQPSGPFLSRYTTDGKEAWQKLWREMLWVIPRGKPTTRGPYNSRADEKPTREGAEVWTDLVLNDRSVQKGDRPETTKVGGAVMLGAQAMSAEAIDFIDRADHALLLHFWQLASRVFVPEQIGSDGKRFFVGYVLAIPEVSDLQDFQRLHTRSLSELSGACRGYYPAEAVVSLAAEGSLEFMRYLMAVAEKQAMKVLPARYLNSVEFFYYITRDQKGKKLRDPKIASHGRIPPRDALLIRYDGLRKDVKNPLLLSGRLRALLDGTPWFAALADDLVEREWSWFVHSTKEGHRTPLAMIGFAWEAGQQFRKLERNEQIMIQERNERLAAGDAGEKLLPTAEAVDRVVYRLVDQFVVQKARARMNVPDDAPRQSTHTHRRVPGRNGGQERWQELPAYQDQRRHVASGLFLALRSRHGDDFVEHFTATLGSVAQYLPLEEYEILAAALMRSFAEEAGEHRPRTRDDVKTLTQLALSAASRSLIAKQEAVTIEAGDSAGEESAS